MKRQKMSHNAKPTGSSKLLIKLEEAVNGRKFYEAHQLLKTINFRFGSSGQHDELEKLLLQYSELLLKNNQVESGCDVAIMLSKLYKENCFAVVEERVVAAARLFEGMPRCPERITYLLTLLEWSGSSELSGKLHKAAVVAYTAEHSYSEAWKHLIRLSNAADASSLATPILRGCQIRPEEYDLAVSSLVLSYLISKKLEVAGTVFALLVKNQVSDLSPLLNGIRFLIEAAKMKCAKTFALIKDIYEPSFSRDPSIRKLVASTGKSLFNLADRRDKSSSSLVPMLLNAFLNPEQANLD